MAGLYVHIPFCEKKCVYCSFYSIETLANRERFLRALLQEIRTFPAGEAEGKEGWAGSADETSPGFETIFFGGGTPSLLSPEEIAAILDALRARFRVEADAEITMECNPGALRREWLEGYRAAGVNRLSFGVQSFHDDELVFLSRIHTAEEAERNISLVRDVFDNVSLDLIFALPGQTPERWRHNLERGVALGTDHISAYSLIFEEGTPLNAMKLKGKVRPAPVDLEADMYEETVAFLGGHGFAQYEVSNYAKQGFACRHNVGYWERRTYLGFGPSAHSFRRAGATGTRWANVSSLNAYLDAVERESSPVISREGVTPGLATDEIVLLGLRSGGILLDDFREATGGELAERAPHQVERMIAAGYATIGDRRLKLTSSGYLFADRFALEILDEIESAHAAAGV